MRSVVAIALVVVPGLACTPPVAPPVGPPVAEGEGDAGAVEGACAAVPTGALTLATVEGEPGYDDALAALDLSTLPAAIAVDALPAFEHDLIAYMLDAPTDNGAFTAVDRDRALATPLGRAVLGAFAVSGDGTLDFAFLRRGLHRSYACQRAFPPTLAAFRASVYDFTADPNPGVVDSRVKGLRRRISADTIAGAFVAETLLSNDAVRETEILLTDRRQDHGIDFLEYDDNGALRSASQFATSTGGQVVGAVPFTCIACHGYTDVNPPPTP